MIFEFCQGKKVIALGDFNLPSLTWRVEEIAMQGRASATDRLFADCLATVDLSQWVLEPIFAISGNILDLFLTSELDRVGSVEVLAPFPQCYHSPGVEYFLGTYWQEVQSPVVCRKWYRGNYVGLCSALSVVDWNLEFLHCSVNESYTRFLSILIGFIDRFVPRFVGDKKLPYTIRPPTSLSRKREAWREHKSLRSLLGRRHWSMML